MEVGVQRARIILAGIEKENGWFCLWWKWDPCPVETPLKSVRDVCHPCEGRFNLRGGGGIGDWCSRGGLPGPPSAGRGFGAPGGGVGGTGPKAPGPFLTSHWESTCGTSEDAGGAGPRAPGPTWRHLVAWGHSSGVCLSGDALRTQPPWRTGQLWDRPQLPGQVPVK